jgi:hypothetical protein
MKTCAAQQQISRVEAWRQDSGSRRRVLELFSDLNAMRNELPTADAEPNGLKVLTVTQKWCADENRRERGTPNIFKKLVFRSAKVQPISGQIILHS